jgi:hypothetical protein
MDQREMRELLRLQHRVDQLTIDLDAASGARDQAVGKILAAGGVSTRQLGQILGISGPRVVQMNNRYRGLPARGSGDPRISLNSTIETEHQ